MDNSEPLDDSDVILSDSGTVCSDSSNISRQRAALTYGTFHVGSRR